MPRMKSLHASREIDDVAVIAECTTSSGPSDDHFIVVVDSSGQEHVFQTNEFLNTSVFKKYSLSTNKLETKLHGVTTNSSRIIFPARLAERELYMYSYRPPQSFFLRMLCVQVVQSEFTDEVQMYLRGLRMGKTSNK